MLVRYRGLHVCEHIIEKPMIAEKRVFTLEIKKEKLVNFLAVQESSYW